MALRLERGFTLIEAMITVAILAILAAVAVPSYRDYVTRGRLVDATSALTSARVRMEQYFQDNRTYKAVNVKIKPPCATKEAVNSWTIVCATAPDTGYVITATGSGATDGFVFAIDQDNRQTTTGLPSGWGTASEASPIACWVIRKGGAC